VRSLLEITFPIQLDLLDVIVLLVLATLWGFLSQWIKQGKLLRWEWDNGAEEPAKRRAINLDNLSFPKNFLWGTATAAHQVHIFPTNG